MRHPGHPSRQIGGVPVVPVDCRIGRPLPPAQFSDRARALFERLALSRRPNWFSGSEGLLAAYTVALITLEDLDVQLLRAKPGTGERFGKLMRMHRQQAKLAARLAVKLRLAPSSKTDKHLPNDGDKPLPTGMGYPERPPVAELDDEALRPNASGERSFEALRRHMMGDRAVVVEEKSEKPTATEGKSA